MSSVKRIKTNLSKISLSSIDKLDDGVGNKFLKKFGKSFECNDNYSIGIEKLSINKQWNNVEIARNNNTFSILWNADTITQHEFVLVDGAYNVPDILLRLHAFMAANDLYCNNTVTGDIVYFIDMEIDPVLYTIAITTIPLPTSAQATTLNYTKPTGATWDFPVTASTPQLIIPTGIGYLFGYEANTYPENIENSTHVFSGNDVPHFNAIGNVNVTCNFVANAIATPSNFIDSFSTEGGISDVIGFQNSNPAMLTCAQNNYDYVLFEFFDKNYKALPIRDNDVSISVLIKHEY